MPPKSPKKLKKGSKAPKKDKNTKKTAPQVQTMSNSGEIKPSQSLLETGARLAGSEVEKGEVEEASQRPTQRPVSLATVSRATLSDEDDDEEDMFAIKGSACMVKIPVGTSHDLFTVLVYNDL